jgi:hypothetical protein
MTTPTSNPIPSTAPQDLLFNTEALDEAINSAAATWQDRLGGTNYTVKGAINSLAAFNNRGTWTALTLFNPRDIALNAGTWYVCLLPHTSAASFATDLAAGRWTVQQGVTSAMLALANASTTIGHTAGIPGAVARTVAIKLNALPNGPTDTGAVGDRTTDDLAAVNLAITGVGLGELYLSNRDFRVSAAPTNPRGVQFIGPGRLLLPETNGFRQLNTYADAGQLVTGLEYLYRVFARVNLGATDPLSAVNVFVYGDSTVEGFVAPPASMDGRFLVQNLLPRLFAEQGVANVTVTNRGVSGTNWSNLNAIPDLSTSTDLLIIKYGINEGALGGTVASRIDFLATNMRAKLTAIRAAANGGLGQCAILLMGPNSVNDTGHGRNEEWFEQVRNVYLQAARDFNCAYFDTYGYLKDSRVSANLWMDNPTPASTGDPLFTLNSSVHPLGLMNAWIWGGMVKRCFPREHLAIWGTNSFTSTPSDHYNPPTSKTPNQYPFGMTWELALAADGWPVDGILVTYRQPDTYSKQFLYPLSSPSAGRTFERWAATGTTWATFWAGQAVVLPGSNSWVSFGSGFATATAVRDAQGIVTVDGRIRSGTTTAGTTMVTLPAGYRPEADHMFLVASSTTTPVRVRVTTAGAIQCDSAGDATATSLSGITFRAAW